MWEHWQRQGHFQQEFFLFFLFFLIKSLHSPLGRLAKRLTSISLVLLAGSSFSSQENSFWKLRGAEKIPTLIETGLSCGKLDLFIDLQCKQFWGAHWINLNLIKHLSKSLNYLLEAWSVWEVVKNLVNQPVDYGWSYKSMQIIIRTVHLEVRL